MAVRHVQALRLLSRPAPQHLQSCGLKTVLSDYESAPLSTHIIHRDDCDGSAKIRSLIG
jgi:hypothetical protein